jgi:hypothetical protein
MRGFAKRAKLNRIKKQKNKKLARKAVISLITLSWKIEKAGDLHGTDTG